MWCIKWSSKLKRNHESFIPQFNNTTSCKLSLSIQIIPDNGDQTHQHIYHNFYNVYWTCEPAKWETKGMKYTNWARSGNLIWGFLKCLNWLHATTGFYKIRATIIQSKFLVAGISRNRWRSKSKRAHNSPESLWTKFVWTCVKKFQEGFIIQQHLGSPKN